MVVECMFLLNSSFWSPKSDMFDPRSPCNAFSRATPPALCPWCFLLIRWGPRQDKHRFAERDGHTPFGWLMEIMVDGEGAHDHGHFADDGWKNIFCESLQALCHVQLQRLSDVALEHQGPHVFGLKQPWVCYMFPASYVSSLALDMRRMCESHSWQSHDKMPWQSDESQNCRMAPCNVPIVFSEIPGGPAFFLPDAFNRRIPLTSNLDFSWGLKASECQKKMVCVRSMFVLPEKND